MIRVFVCLLLATAASFGSGSASNCALCRGVVDIAERILVLNSTSGVDKFHGIAEGLCRYMPRELNRVCEDATEELPGSVFRCLVQDLDLPSLCSAPEIGLCDTPALPLPKVECANHIPSKRGCAACKFVVKSLKHYTVANVRDTVTEALSICRVHLPGDAQAQCQALVGQHGATMVKLLSDRLDSEDFCCDTGFCVAPPPPHPPMPLREPPLAGHPVEGPFQQMWESGRMETIAREAKKDAVIAEEASKKRERVAAAEEAAKVERRQQQQSGNR